MRIFYFQTHQSLGSLAEACLSLTPKILVHKDREIFMDIGITLPYFGNEKKILSTFEQLCQVFKVQGAWLTTDHAAWARTLFDHKNQELPVGKSFLYLQTLPIERLVHLGDPRTADAQRSERSKLVRFMRRVGMETILDFSRLSATAISRRFGCSGLLLQEWINGPLEFTIPTFIPPQTIQQTIDVEDISCWEGLIFPLKEQLSQIESRLLGRNRLAKTLQLTFQMEHSKKSYPLLLSEPTASATHLLKILEPYVGSIHLNSPLQKLELSVCDTTPATPSQLSLFDKTENRTFSSCFPFLTPETLHSQ